VTIFYQSLIIVMCVCVIYTNQETEVFLCARVCFSSVRAVCGDSFSLSICFLVCHFCQGFAYVVMNFLSETLGLGRPDGLKKSDALPTV
jgi:hypothetical protein